MSSGKTAWGLQLRPQHDQGLTSLLQPRSSPRPSSFGTLLSLLVIFHFLSCTPVLARLMAWKWALVAMVTSWSAGSFQDPSLHLSFSWASKEGYYI